ncbi:MAG: amino acid permease [Rhodothermales bacterium]|nr:amino acid permease [Rhodothermales bacterium]
MADDTHVGEEELVRAIGPRALGLNVVNCVVGGGIFVLPGLVAVHLGSAAVIAYLVCSAGVALVFLCFAEVGTRITRSGGAYAYVEEAFGPFAGFVCSILFWFGWSVLSDAAITVAMVETIEIALPVLGEPIPRAAFIIGLLAFLAGVNIIGVKSGVRVFVFNTVVKLVPLVLLLVVGPFALNLEHLRIEQVPSLASVGSASVILFFAFAGAESSLSASGEIERPTRTVPLGLLVGLLGILMLYVGLQTVSQGVLGPALANSTEAPLAAAAKAVFGEWGANMLLVGGVISIFGTISGDMLNSPRVVFASARDGNLPQVLARVHPKYKTPYTAIIFMAIVIGLFALSGTFKHLAVVASGSILLIYLAVSLAVIRLRHRDGAPGQEQFRLPLGPAIPILSALVVGWLLLQLSGSEAIGLAALVGASVILYGVKIVLRRRQ